MMHDAFELLKADQAELIRLSEHIKRGRWIMDDTAEAYDIQGVKTWAVKAKCSECGLVCRFIEAHGIYDYCPRCGAKAVCDYDAPTIEEEDDDSDNADP